MLCECLFQTFRDAENYMRVQYDAQSLCQFARLLRENHNKITVGMQIR